MFEALNYLQPISRKIESLVNKLIKYCKLDVWVVFNCVWLSFVLSFSLYLPPSLFGFFGFFDCSFYFARAVCLGRRSDDDSIRSM